MEFIIIIGIFILIFLLFLKAPRLDEDSREDSYEHSRQSVPQKRWGTYRDNYAADGFLNPNQYPIALTDHARQRMRERIQIHDGELMKKYACDAYRYGKSARQLNHSAAYQVRQIEQKEGKIVLLYKNYIYIFSEENVLITVYENEHIKI